MLDNIPKYEKLRNAYNPAHYPANKKITSEEWNALWMSVVHQGNRQEEMLELIINTYLSEQVISINAIDAKASAALSNSESALNAANRAESNSETAVTLAEGADGKSDNAVETANTAAGDAAEALSKANTAISDSSIALNTANAADEKADEAILTAGGAHDTASGIDAKATSALSNSESAVSDASAALSTANAASSNASTALSTANTAAEDARAAVITANSAHDIATGIDAKATSALSNSETAVSDASEALSKANTAISDSSTALSTANTAAGDASEALGKANTAISDSSTALSTANIAASDASSAVTTAGTADGKADSAVETAEEALALIETAIQTGGTQIKNAGNITITTSRLLQVSDLVDFPTYFTVETNLISAPLFVNRLDTKVDKVTGSRLITDTEATKLSGIATGAQVNVLESITLNSTPLTVANKDIDLSNKFLELTGTQSVEGKKTFEDIDIDGDLKVTGDIIQQGSSYITEAEHLKIADSLMFLRNGAITGLLPGEFTGMQAVKYDGTNDGQLVFDKDGVARVGDIGSLQPLATREESPSDNGFARWNATAKRFEAVGLKQTTGQSTTDIMSQKIVTDELDLKANKTELSISVWDGTYPAIGAFSTIGGTGTGTPGNPYIIDSAKKLAWLSSNYAQTFATEKYYKQTKDIDLAGHEWTPINRSTTARTYHYNGSNFLIKNLLIDDVLPQDYAGLFGNLEDGVIENVHISEGYVQGKNYVGSIVGSINGSVANSAVLNCSNRADVFGTNHTGGIIGSFKGGHISGCSNFGIIGAFSGIGGGVAGESFSNILRCYNFNNISGTAATTKIGGIVGELLTGRRVITSVNLGNISSSATVSGPTGSAALIANGGTVTDCIAEGTLTGTNKDYRGQKADKGDLDSHLVNTGNPHGVTKAQVGLGSVDNTADTTKPISTAQQTVLNQKDVMPYSQHNTGAGNGYRLVAKFDYSASTGDDRKVFRFKVKQGHGNGTSYVFWGDYIVGLGTSNQITCAGLLSKSDGTFGKCGYRVDTANKTIYFYIWTGQYSAYFTSDITSLSPGTKGEVAWYSEAGLTADTVTEGINTYYPTSSGTLATTAALDGKISATYDSATDTYTI